MADESSDTPTATPVAATKEVSQEFLDAARSVVVYVEQEILDRLPRAPRIELQSRVLKYYKTRPGNE